MNKTFHAAIVGGDSVEVTIQFDKNSVVETKWNVIGRVELLSAIEKLKSQLKGDLQQVPVPVGRAPEQLLLKELILKIKGKWGEEPSDPELCHCRKIPQSHVERAIILGAHTIEKVRQRSSANTGCGTCLPDVEALFKKYLG